MTASLPFIGRDVELQALERRWASGSSDLFVLYGRRRVGKTELLRRLAQDKRVLSAVGTRSDARRQIAHFVAEMARLFNDPSLTLLGFSDWDVVFARLTDGLKKLKGKILVILDEFQWMAEASPEIPSLIQKWWDRSWSRDRKLMLVLCGSYLGFMEREVLGKKSPLFGRRTAVLQLEPLPFSESRLFHPHLPIKEQVKRHILCGGIPAYHKLFVSKDSLIQQIVEAFFVADAPLAKEADFLLLEELKDPKFYFSLLENLGSSRMTMSDLARSLGIERSRVPYYTKNLLDLRSIGKSHPLLMYSTQIQRKTLYHIKDPLLRFWFSFVYPNGNAMERMDPRLVYSTMVAPYLDAFWGKGFESLAMEQFLKKRIIPTLAEPFKVGGYWDKNIQIDFTIALKSGFSYFGETKWTQVNKKTIDGFTRKLAYFDGQVDYGPVFICADTVGTDLKKNSSCQVYSLSDLL